MQGMGRDILTVRCVPTLLLTVSAVVLVLDQVTKAIVRASMQPGSTISLVDGVFHLTHVRNTGAAFGLMPGYQPMFIAVGVAVLTGIALFVWFARSVSRWVSISLGLIVGGSVGNLIDRVLTGHVTDFFDPQVFPVFNIADSGVVVGVAGLVVWTLFLAGRETETLVQADRLTGT